MSPPSTYFQPRHAGASDSYRWLSARSRSHCTSLSGCAGGAPRGDWAKKTELLLELDWTGLTAAPHWPQNLCPGGFWCWQMEQLTSWFSVGLTSVDLISADLAEDSRRACSAIRMSEVSFLICCKSLLIASSRFPGGLLKYT